MHVLLFLDFYKELQALFVRGNVLITDRLFQTQTIFLEPINDSLIFIQTMLRNV